MHPGLLDSVCFRQVRATRGKEPRHAAVGVAHEWVTQLLGETDAKVFKKYSQISSK